MTTTTDAPQVASTDFTGDLRTLLPARPPSTVEAGLDGAVGDTIGADAAAAMYTNSDPTMASLAFARLGFRQAVYTAWTDRTAGVTVTVGLFQFADFHGAFVFSGGVQRTYEESPDADRGAMLERIFEARWYASKPLGDATYLATAYSKGSIAVWIRMVGRTDLPKLTRLAEEQYVRLP
jgi:hypothetical protein